MPLIKARINDVVKTLFLINAIGFAVNVGSVDIDNALSGLLQGVAGSYITMVCDLRDTDANFIWFRTPNYIVSMGDSLIANLPSEIANRLTVSCFFELEACYLTIDDLRKRDEGPYGCGYVSGDIGLRISSASATLVISVPPTESSPRCFLYNDSYTVISPDIVNVRDKVRFVCVTTDGDPNPSVYIARDGLAISLSVGTSFDFKYTLSQSDEGSTFTCVMTHPALSQPRNCTFLTLSSSRTTTVLQSQEIPITDRTERPEITTEDSTEKFNREEEHKTSTVSPEIGEASSNTHLQAIIIVIAVLVIIIVCLLSFLVVIWRRKSTPVPVKADQQRNPAKSESHQPTDTYIELSTQRDNHHEYTMLKTQTVPDNTDDGAYATPDDDEYAYASPQTSDYEVNIISNEVKRADQEAPQDTSSAPSYANATVILKGKIPKN